MIRLLASTAVAIIANALALLVADAVLEDMSVNGVGFITAVLVFSVVMILATPLLRQVAMTKANALIGSVALVATLASLIITTLVTDGLTISGGVTWLAATVIVWLIALAARLLLPLVIFKHALAEVRQN